MSILSVDTISPIGSGTTITLNAEKIVVGTGITFESNGQAIYAGVITATSFVGNLSGNISGDFSVDDKIIHSGDTNTAIRFPAADTITAETAGTERLRITSTGKIGINSTSPSHTLDVVGGYQALGLYRNDYTGNSGAGIQLNFGRAKANGDLFNAALITAVGSDNTAQASEFRFSVLTSGSMSEKVRIDTNGRLLVGGTGNTDSDIRLYLHNPSATGSQMQLTGNASGTGNSDGLRIGYNGSGGQIWLFENGYLRFATNNAERMRISSEGYVTIPNQPSFAVYRNQQSWTIADGGKMNFNTARHNIGNHYDLSNGRFIAPVTGSYQLNFYSIVQGNYTNAYIQLKVNGNRIYGGDTHWTLTNNSGNWHNVSYSQVVYLTASQYVEIFSYTGTGSGNVVWHGNNWGCFSGYLIG